MSIGIPDCITEASMAVVVLLFNQSILRFIGEDALVSYSVICYVNTLILSTMIGISQGMQPICSYYYGKKDREAVLNILDMGLKVVKVASVASFLIVVIFTNQIVSMFIDKIDENMFNYTVTTLRVFSFAFLIMGYNVITSGFCTAIGRPMLAGVVSIGRGVVVITISLVVMLFLFGGKGIWIATVVSEVVVLVMARMIMRSCRDEIEESKYADVRIA